MPDIRKVIRAIQARPILADLSALIGMVYFLFQIWTLAHNQISVLDEGLYLFKGWLFSSEQYRPFQDYGAWTNQMPLAFLIPGRIQIIFGPGLRTGRMLAVTLAVLMVLGLWMTSRRLGGRWVAAAVVLAITLNSAGLRMFALSASQGLVACLLVWTLWFSLGEDREPWHLLMAGILAGSTVMVRINLLPLLPLLAAYLVWTRGWRAAVLCAGGMLISFGGIHQAYWPNILRLWARSLPFGFLQEWFPPVTTPTWNPDNPLAFRIASFFLAFRYHFAALVGSLLTLIFWPTWKRTQTGKRKIAIFLVLLLVSLFLLHAWAALGNEYCVFCFPTYTAFYSCLGLLLTAITLPYWNLNPSLWRKWAGGLAFLAVLAGMAYSAESAAENMLGELFYKHLLGTSIPGLNGVQAWQLFANKFQLDYQIIYDVAHAWLPVAAALIVGLLFLAIAGFDRKYRTGWGFGLVICALLGSLLAPLPFIAGDYQQYDCPPAKSGEPDLISRYETAAYQVASSIPAGSKLYWAGYSPVTLLYLPGVQIYPAQLHGTYSFRISSETDSLLKYGWWNEALAIKWLDEADFVLAEQRNLEKDDWLITSGLLEQYDLIKQTAPQSCQESSALFLYRRK